MRTLLLLMVLSSLSYADDLVTLDSLGELKTRFNAGKDRVRFIAIVSPT